MLFQLTDSEEIVSFVVVGSAARSLLLLAALLVLVPAVTVMLCCFVCSMREMNEWLVALAY